MRYIDLEFKTRSTGRPLQRRREMIVYGAHTYDCLYGYFPGVPDKVCVLEFAISERRYMCIRRDQASGGRPAFWEVKSVCKFLEEDELFSKACKTGAKGSEDDIYKLIMFNYKRCLAP